MGKNRATLVAILAASCLLVAAPALSQASPLDNVQVRSSGPISSQVVIGTGQVQATPEHQEDLEAYLSTLGTELFESEINALAVQEQFEHVVAVILEHHSDIFVEHGIDPSNGGEARISFTSPLPQSSSSFYPLFPLMSQSRGAFQQAQWSWTLHWTSPSLPLETWLDHTLHWRDLPQQPESTSGSPQVHPGLTST